MNHDNKNELLALYFQEGHSHRIKKSSEHVKQCDECQQYLHEIENIDQKFSLLSEETLPSQLNEQILKAILQKKQPHVQRRFIFNPRRIVQFIFSFIGLVVLFVLIKQTIIASIFPHIKDCWMIESIGELGLSAFILWILGFIVCIIITPVLILEYQNPLNETKYSWKYLYSK